MSPERTSSKEEEKYLEELREAIGLYDKPAQCRNLLVNNHVQFEIPKKYEPIWP